MACINSRCFGCNFCHSNKIWFDVLTWNIEHHGFTSNTAMGGKSWTREGDHTRSGYNETEEELTCRLANVFRVIAEHSARHTTSIAPGLMGFNEIGILAFDKILKLIPEGNYKLFASIADVRLEISRNDGEFFEVSSLSGMTGLKHLSDFNECVCSSSPDVEKLYGNVIAINTDVWGIIKHTTVAFPGSKTYRSNTALVTQLRYHDAPGPDVIWIHTHLKYSEHDKEKTLQIATVERIVKNLRTQGLTNIVISGDLYLSPASTYMTKDIGFMKTHGHKTQIFSNPDDADQILIPDSGEIELVKQIQLLGSINDRIDLSDHAGVTCTLQLTSNKGDGTLPQMDFNTSVPGHIDIGETDVMDAVYKERVGVLYRNMFNHVMYDSTWNILE